MRISRRMRLIWQELWLPPLLGLTADALRAELMKQLGLNPGFTWTLTTLGLVLTGIVAFGRYLIVPSLPLNPTINEELTQKVRLLYKKQGLPAVRVSIAPLATRLDRGYAFQDGSDLFVDPEVLERPNGERDFIILFSVLTQMSGTALMQISLPLFAGLELILIRVALDETGEKVNSLVAMIINLVVVACIWLIPNLLRRSERRFGVNSNRWDVPILKVTEDLPGALGAIAWLRPSVCAKAPP